MDRRCALRRAMLRRRLLASLFALILCLPSCFTTALWSAGCDSDGLSSSQILGRALLTPIAVCLDLVTLGAQAAVFGDDDGGDCDWECGDRRRVCDGRHRR